mgnify:CR=1 FL=1
MAKKMTKRAINKKAVTVMELVIVATLSCVILGVGMAMMRRSNTQFKKSNDLISIQRLMDNIIERIRSDVRSLKRVVPSSDGEAADSNVISFTVVKYDGDSDAVDKDDLTHLFNKITYQYKPDDKTLYRFETTDCDEYGEGGVESNTSSDFHGARQVISMSFEPVFNNDNDIDDSQKKGDDFKCLNVAMQIAANEYSGKESDASTLSIACQFYSTCVESELRISKLREK